MANYYEILKIDNIRAPFSDIKKNYRILTRENHPDKIGDADRNYFYKIQEAWRVLSDSATRNQYNALLKDEELSHDLTVSDEISKNLMTLSDDGKFYTRACRCGGQYVVNVEELTSSKCVVNCDCCSLSIGIS